MTSLSSTMESAVNASKKITDLFAARNTTKNLLKEDLIDFAIARRKKAVANISRSVQARRRRRATIHTVLGLKPRTQEHVLAFGRILLHISLFLYAFAFHSDKWVCRVYSNPEDEFTYYGRNAERKASYMEYYLKKVPNISDIPPKSLYCFGVWTACDIRGRCDHVWNIVPGISKATVRWIQALATLTLMGYVVAVVMDASSRITLFVCLAFNRVVEMTVGPSAVLHFLTLMYEAGEVKNRAKATRGLRDESSWGLHLSVTSLFFSVVSTCIMALFRLAPQAYSHRRFWQLPLELRTKRPYLVAAATDIRLNAGGSYSACKSGGDNACTGVEGSGAGKSCGGSGRRSKRRRNGAKRLDKGSRHGGGGGGGVAGPSDVDPGIEKRNEGGGALWGQQWTPDRNANGDGSKQEEIKKEAKQSQTPPSLLSDPCPVSFAYPSYIPLYFKKTQIFQASASGSGSGNGRSGGGTVGGKSGGGSAKGSRGRGGGSVRGVSVRGESGVAGIGVAVGVGEGDDGVGGIGEGDSGVPGVGKGGGESGGGKDPAVVSTSSLARVDKF